MCAWRRTAASLPLVQYLAVCRLPPPRVAMLLLALAGSAISGLARGAEQHFAAPPPVAAAGADGGAGLVQVTASLALVLAAIFAVGWLLRRLRSLGRLGADTIEILADTSLGTKERAVLIQIGTQQLLLGVAQGRVNLLHVLKEPLSAATLRGGPAPADAEAAKGAARLDFKAVLKRSLGR